MFFAFVVQLTAHWLNKD